MKSLIKEKSIGKEVKKMKRLFVLPIIVVGLILALSLDATAATTETKITGYDETTTITMIYDPFGVPIGQKAYTKKTITRKTTTTNDDGTTTESTTTETTEQWTSATYRSGVLKTDKVDVKSKTTDKDGKTVSEYAYTDTYTYDDNGRLTNAAGSGTSTQYEYDADGNVVKTTRTTITREFETINGQAVLKTQVDDSTTTDKDGNVTGSAKTTTEYTNEARDGQIITTKAVATTKGYNKNGRLDTTTVSTTEYEYEYKGGSWVTSKKTETKHYEKYGDNDAVIASEDTQFKTTYTRGAGGELTGISKEMVYGRRMDASTGSPYYYRYENYEATAVKDARFGWYIQKEKWDEVYVGDPAATGTAYKAADGTWHMKVKVWTNAEKTEWEEIDITLDLSLLDEETRAEVESILQAYATSGEDITLYGLSSDGKLYDGATLQVLGLGKGSFEKHPFDY